MRREDQLAIVGARLFAGNDAGGIAWDGERAEPVIIRAAELVPAPYLGEIAGPLSSK